MQVQLGPMQAQLAPTQIGGVGPTGGLLLLPGFGFGFLQSLSVLQPLLPTAQGLSASDTQTSPTQTFFIVVEGAQQYGLLSPQSQYSLAPV